MRGYYSDVVQRASLMAEVRHDGAAASSCLCSYHVLGWRPFLGAAEWLGHRVAAVHLASVRHHSDRAARRDHHSPTLACPWPVSRCTVEAPSRCSR